MPEGEEPASELLHLAQPTMPRRLMQLEEELGAELFKRRGTHIGLTEGGLTFVTLSPPIENGTVLVRKKGSDIFGGRCCLH